MKIFIKFKFTYRSNYNVLFKFPRTRVLSWRCWTFVRFSYVYTSNKCWLQSQFGCLRSTAPSWFPIFNNIVSTATGRNIVSFRIFPLYISCTIKSTNITWYDLIFTSSYTSIVGSDGWKDKRMSIILIAEILDKPKN